MSDNDNSGCSVSVGGISAGSAIAAGVSWYVNHSIGFAILHLFLSWFYVAYALVVHYDRLFSTATP